MDCQFINKDFAQLDVLLKGYTLEKFKGNKMFISLVLS
jgi:hypothetical protein